MAVATRATAGIWSALGVLNRIGPRFAGADDRLLVLLDVCQTVDHPTADLQELRPFARPAPTLKGPMANLPTDCQLKLVHAFCLHLRALSLWQVRLRHDEGVTGEYYQGVTG